MSAHVLPDGDVIWKQYRLSSQSTAMTELLSRSRTIPPATAPRGWHMRLPPWVKKKSLSQAVVTKPVLLANGTGADSENQFSIVMKSQTARGALIGIRARVWTAAF